MIRFAFCHTIRGKKKKEKINSPARCGSILESGGDEDFSTKTRGDECRLESRGIGEAR
jgi:hypothetical protein